MIRDISGTTLEVGQKVKVYAKWDNDKRELFPADDVGEVVERMYSQLGGPDYNIALHWRGDIVHIEAFKLEVIGE